MDQPKAHKIIIRNGVAHFIYSDEMKPFLEIGQATVKRVSHVEPVMVDGKIQWEADLSPVNGPKLGPVPERETALRLEIAWLNANNLGV